jgi:hypothetical protein
MKLKEILKCLCWYDPRNPNYYNPFDAEDERKPRENCYCDNCFYGRDALALEIINLRELLKMETELTGDNIND